MDHSREAAAVSTSFSEILLFVHVEGRDTRASKKALQTESANRPDWELTILIQGGKENIAHKHGVM